MSCNSKRNYRGPGLIPFGSASLRVREPFPWGGKQAGRLVLSLSLLVVGALSAAQAPTGQNSGDKEIATQEVQSPFKVHAQRNMVLVRVIVRDSNGRPVPGFQKGDFRLFDNGKPQDIDQFAVETFGRAPTTSPQTPEKEPGDEAGLERAPADLTPRNFQALYFDDVQMKYEDIVYSRDAADRYLTATLTPASRVGIFTSSGQGNLDFTDDRSQLHDTLFALRPRPILPTSENACPDISPYQAHLIVDERDPNAIAIASDEAIQCECQGLTGPALQSCEAEAAQRVQGEAISVMNEWETQYTEVLRGLEQVIRRTALLPGQRSVIFLSPGFLTYNLETQISDVTERALRSNVVVNTLDPRGLYVVIPGGDVSQQQRVIPSNASLVGMKSQIQMDEISRAEDVLSNLAVDTGGQFFHNSNDLDAGFRRVGALSQVSYVLAFSPHNLKFDGRFHKLKVSLVNPRGFTLQARRGYFAPRASEDAATKAKEEIEEAVYSQDEMRELPIDVHTQFYRVNESDVRLAVFIHLDMAALRFHKEQDRNLNDLTFITVLFDRDGKYVKGIEKELQFRLRDATLAKLTQSGITLKTEFDLRPGTYMVRQIVRDSQAGQLSGLSRTVEIPY